MRILVTCPPMIGAREYFMPLFEAHGWQAVVPTMAQTVSHEELMSLVPSCDGWIIGDDLATREIFTAGKSGRLKAAVKWGVGTDNVDFAACRDLGIPITNTPNMFGAEVADIAVGYVIGLARHTFIADREIRQGLWPKRQGISLLGKVAGVVGYGDIGRHLCKRLQSLGMQLIVWDPFVKTGEEEVPIDLWPQNVAKCDFLIFTCALNDGTKHMLHNSVLQKARHGVRIVNVARGQLIDEKALVQALVDGKVASAALDVFEEEPLDTHHRLREFPQCIFGSHNASNTREGVMRATLKSVASLHDFLQKS